MLAIFGDRQTAVGRELTKAHEELVVRPISQLLQLFSEPRGEFTLVVAPSDREVTPSAELPAIDVLVREFGDLTNNINSSRRDVIRTLAQKYGLTSRDMYRLLESGK
jgi:16S rRNA (cytidine1402-2'-O)-methyltransferase